MTAADTKLFIDIFKQIMDADDDPAYTEDNDKVQAIDTSSLSIDEALDITFAAFDYFIRRYYDGDAGYIEWAKNYGKQVCEKARALKAEYKERFDAAAVIAAFHCL